MQRITTSTRAVDLFGPGKDGFKDGDLANGIVPTDLNAEFFNDVQEELCAIVEAAGMALNAADKSQLLKALRAPGVSHGISRHTSNGSFVVPDGVTTIYLSGCGGGGGGGGGGAGGASAYTGAGGGSGAAAAHCLRQPMAVTPGATLNITIGAGGNGTSASSGPGSTGGTGGTTTITGLNAGTVSWAGGTGGQGGNQASLAASSGGTAGTGGAPTLVGQAGAGGSKGMDVGSYSNNVPGGQGAVGASGPFGGGGGAGSGATATSGSQNGLPASGYGAGGGGGGGIWAQSGGVQTGGPGGAGSGGFALIEW